MVNRMSLDLGTARTNESIIMKGWKYLYIGECSGNVTIRLDSPSASSLDPAEFDKLTGIEEFKHLYVTNIAQSGEKLNMYYEEETERDRITRLNIGIERSAVEIK